MIGVNAGAEVLSPKTHILQSLKLGSLVDEESPSRTVTCEPFKTSEQNELVVRHVNGFEVARQLKRCQVVFVYEVDLLEVSQLFLVRVGSQLMAVEHDQRHRVVRVVGHSAYLVDD